ncbi:MAG: hypothetical protein JJ863_21640 [Deltaproteobacteria bacterium]|nr:hypothetical protein [Deltaproteobacteria bacterium]
MRPFARALREGDLARARVLWQATTDRLGLIALPDHEGELFEGVLVPREEALAPNTVAELAKSWERLDRAYAPCEDDALRAEVEAAVADLARTTGLTADLGEDHLFVFLGPLGEAAAVARFTGDAWRTLVDVPEDDVTLAVGRAFRTRRDSFG